MLNHGIIFMVRFQNLSMKNLLFLFCIILTACSHPQAKVIVLQPLGDFDQEFVVQVSQQIQSFNTQVVILKNTEFPEGSFYKPRQRYRADRIIAHLRNIVGTDSVIVGLTSKDISTTKGKHQDWGVMGLGYRPGNACVVSMFRLSVKNKKEQFYKVVLHELGHTEGLDHCPDQSCLMRDAEGGNPLDQEKSFCLKCRNFLIRKGWKLKP